MSVRSPSSLKKSKPRKIVPDPLLLEMIRRTGADPKVVLGEPPKRRKGESLLGWRVRTYDIPPLTYDPPFDQVVVWRLPDINLTASGIIIPQFSEDLALKHPNFKGVLLAWGPRAMDELMGMGYELGHIVVFGRFAGWEHGDHAANFQRSVTILQMHGKELNGSEDVKRMRESGEITWERAADGRHQLVRHDVKRLTRAEVRRRKLEALADGTDNANEADAARKLAAKKGK